MQSQGSEATRTLTTRSRLALLLPASAYVALVFVLGSMPTGGGPPGVSDKALHLLAFIPLPGLSERATRLWLSDIALSRRYLISAAFASLLGGLLELWQAVLPHRSCDLLDWVSDTAGAAIGAVLGLGVYSLLNRRNLS